MNETATLHFDLSHLRTDQPFTLRAGAHRYTLARHTRQTRILGRRSNTALDLVPEERNTHFVPVVALPAHAPILLRVSAPGLRHRDRLDRLVWMGIHIPRRYRMAGVAARRRRGSAAALVPPKLAAYGATTVPIPDDQLVDVGDFGTAMDAAMALIFHHPEMMALQPTPADTILSIIETAQGLNPLALSILGQSKEHEKNPNVSNWIESRPGTNWQTGAPANDIYAWSDETLEWLAQR